MFLAAKQQWKFDESLQVIFSSSVLFISNQVLMETEIIGLYSLFYLI